MALLHEEALPRSRDWGASRSTESTERPVPAVARPAKGTGKPVHAVAGVYGIEYATGGAVCAGPAAGLTDLDQSQDGNRQDVWTMANPPLSQGQRH